ncbi:MAG: N-acetylglucosaminyl transferase [Gammaproteobacteria bacterium]|jgi:lipopolysaccharide biosynthesis regulator YciM|nr:N-acetylglucosaminyl transferase [Gammaproteobacteria bacterium]
MTFFIFIFFIALAFWLGRRSIPRNQDQLAKIQISKNYFKGLNYLLNEENDKALNTFIQSMTVDGDTIETHLALGGLFRRRGELTRAIRVHQNLLARPTLTVRERAQARLALAYDYLAAGMLDRAEQSFLEIVDYEEFQEEAWTRLLDIYQREKRWQQAIDVAEKLQRKDPEIRLALAHHHCELAQIALKRSDLTRAEEMLKKARKYQRRLARIDLLLGDLYLAEKKTQKALQTYQLIADHDEDYLSEAIPKVVLCYDELKDDASLETYLAHCQERAPRTMTAIELTKLKLKRSSAEALQYLQTELKKHPSLRGILFLIELQNQQKLFDEKQWSELQTFYNLAQGILHRRAYYRCGHCGFSGRMLFWQCPSCKRWSTMKPIHGLEGD